MREGSSTGNFAGLITYVGFVFSAVSLLYWINPNLRVFGLLVQPGLVAIGVFTAFSGVISLYGFRPFLAGDSVRAGTTFWIASAVAWCAFIAAATIPAEQTWSYLGSGTSVIVVSMILAWRIHVAAYVLLAVMVGVVATQVFHDSWLGFGAFVFVASGMAACNYVYLLVSDHRLEAKRLLGRLRRNQPVGHQRISLWTLCRAFIIWLPALGLVYGGWLLHEQFQSELKRALYESKTITIEGRPELTDRVIDQRNVEEDWIQNLNLAEFQEKKHFNQKVQAGFAEAEMLAKMSKDELREKLEENKPNAVPDSPCDKLVARIKGIRLGSMRTGCRNAFSVGNVKMQQRYAALEMRLNKIAADAVENGHAESEDKQRELLLKGEQLISEEYEAYRLGVRRVGQLAEVTKYLGWAALIGALLAGYQMVLGRLLFDANDPSASFQLSDGEPQPFEFTISTPVGSTPAEGSKSKKEVLNLKDLVWGDETKRKKYWYATYQVTRHSSRMDTRLPQPLNCLLQRLFSNRLFLTRIDPSQTYPTYEWRGSERIRIDKSREPVLSVRGDAHLVAIKLKINQEVHFFMRDLVAFSDDVQLRSIYSTHVAGELLALGTFQSVAIGEGYLVLKSDGMDVASSTDEPTPASRLLAWDRRTKFCLDQTLGWKGAWIDDPNLQLLLRVESAVLDEGTEYFRFPSKVWRLLRYLFLPF